MVSEQPNRAERRRQEKEQAKQDEKGYGPVSPREFDKCPVCGCPARFTLEAMKDEISEHELKRSPTVLGAMKYEYQTPLYNIELIVVYDSCVKCGALYTVARDKKKRLRLAPPGPLGPRPFIGKG